MTKSKQELVANRVAGRSTYSDIAPESITTLSASLTVLLADVFALYVKTKNFHWHMSGQHFRDYHLLLDEHGNQLFAMTDEIAERARKIGGTTLRSIGHIARIQRIHDNDAEDVTPIEMLRDLLADNKALTLNMRSLHALCDEAGDLASASLLETWIDDAQRRSWFLYETSRGLSEQAQLSDELKE